MSTIDQIFGKVGIPTDMNATEKRLKPRAYAWARVSTDMQEKMGLSIPEQLRQISEFAEREGYEVVAEYQEAGSAFREGAKRVKFDKMVRDALKDKSITAIIVHDYSRFSRNSEKMEGLLRKLRAGGVSIVSATEMPIDGETSMDTWMKHITLAKNEAYSREIAFHTLKGCRSNVQTRDPEMGRCYKNGGLPLFGYKLTRLRRGEIRQRRAIIKTIWEPNDTLVAGKQIHESARHLLVEMAAKGASLDQLRDFCNAKGIPAARRDY